MPIAVGDAGCGREGGRAGGREENASTHHAFPPSRLPAIDQTVESWRIDDEWWRQAIHRRYVEVVLEGGAHVVLFEDEVTSEWFVQMP